MSNILHYEKTDILVKLTSKAVERLFGVHDLLDGPVDLDHTVKRIGLHFNGVKAALEQRDYRVAWDIGFDIIMNLTLLLCCENELASHNPEP